MSSKKNDGVLYTMIPKLQYAIYLAILLWLLSACASNTGADPTPPAIHYGEDVCELCNMIVSEADYAAAYVTGDGRGHKFDDIGDMFKSHAKFQEDVRAFFVHDYQDKHWIRAETAHFVQSDSLITPMLSGLAAFESPEVAAAFATENQGQVLSFDGLLAHYRSSATSSSPMHGH